MRSPATSQLYRIICSLLIFAWLAPSACAPSADPIDRINAIYDEVIRMLKEPSQEGKDTKKQIDEFLASKSGEIAAIQRQLNEEMTKAQGSSEEREAFISRFDRLAARLREVQALLEEKGLELSVEPPSRRPPSS
jgi:ABC-type transporter MlaC component